MFCYLHSCATMSLCCDHHLGQLKFESSILLKHLNIYGHTYSITAFELSTQSSFWVGGFAENQENRQSLISSVIYQFKRK